ncbi:hypothetical protein [Wenzhouxiangella sp. EGI_FJ10305]|uniref:hypothetical protein n=1 Tax=Wenzhouxiangella sp. EGI_FJ10305 TaxID=3243768 RepID=UPI0035D8D05E
MIPKILQHKVALSALLAVGLAVTAQSVFGQQLIEFVDGTGQTVERIELADGSVVKLQSGGDLRAVAKYPDRIGEPELSIPIFITGDDAVTVGDSIRVIWAAEGASQCAPTSTDVQWTAQSNLNTSGWTDYVVELETGSHNLGIRCEDNDANSIVENISFSVVQDDGGSEPVEESPTIDQFYSNDSTVTAGDSFTLTWRTSNATSCSTSGYLASQWSVSDPTSGSATLTVPNSEPDATKTLTLTCENPAGSDTSSVTIAIKAAEEDDGGSEIVACTGDRAPPADFKLQSRILCDKSTGTCKNLSSSFTSWKSLFSDAFANGNKETLKLKTNRYGSLKFNSSEASEMEISTIFNGTFAGASKAGSITISISECSGDFSTTVEDEGCMLGKQLNTPQNFNFDRCSLKPNTDYYLNFFYGVKYQGDFYYANCSEYTDGCQVTFDP